MRAQRNDRTAGTPGETGADPARGLSPKVQRIVAIVQRCADGNEELPASVSASFGPAEAAAMQREAGNAATTKFIGQLRHLETARARGRGQGRAQASVQRAKAPTKPAPTKPTPTAEKAADMAPADKQARFNAGLAAIKALESRGDLAPKALHAALTSIKERFGFQRIEARRRDDNTWLIYAKLNPDNADNLLPLTGKTLILGEGNFTFTESAMTLGLNVPGNVRATEYKPKGEVTADPEVAARVQKLEASGVTVEFGVDGRTIHERYPTMTFNTIVWMFPHPGGARHEAAARGRAMLAAFFASAADRLAPGGRVMITLRATDWYLSRWRPVESAAAAGLRKVGGEGKDDPSMEFFREDYPGYTHETTANKAAKPQTEFGYTYIFTNF